MTQRNMDRWLGDGGMAIIGAVGGSLRSYGVDGEDLGWVEGTFEPTPLAANPHGTVQAGVHAVLLDAAMNFAINAALTGRDRTVGTIEISAELLRPASTGSSYRLRGEVVRLARQVAHAEATLVDAKGDLVSRASGTFVVHRE
ncbi:MAG: PaaI family thioesterase [Acidobacteriota bacterium]|nr:PaaI family thioesterase [Acidobacteriota bacterium]